LCSPQLLIQLASQRSVVGMIDDITEESLKLALHNLWQSNNDSLDSPTHGKQYQDLVRRGLIFKDSSDKSVSIICPLSKQIILYGLYRGNTRPSEDNFKSLGDFFEACLKMIPAEFFHAGMSEHSSGGINEAKWQKEIYKCGSSILAKNYEIGVEVSQGFINNADMDTDDDDEKEYFKINGRIDFYINSDRQWALELLVRGDLSMGSMTSAEEHCRRFSQGQYSSLPRKDELVVDFRPLNYSHSKNDMNIDNPPKKYKKNMWIVFYDTTKMIVIKYGEKKQFVEKKVLPIFGNLQSRGGFGGGSDLHPRF